MVMLMIMSHEGKTHFGDGPKGRVNHCYGNVSAAEMLKVKLLPTPCLPLEKTTFNEELLRGYF